MDLAAKPREAMIDVKCPVCRVASNRTADAPDWGEWRVCGECTLEFVHPLQLPEQPEDLYDGAYGGKRHESAMGEFSERVAIRHALIEDPTLWFWTSAFEDTIAWLKQRVGTGATVLEVGCGLGFLLHTLKREGFRPVGLDVAQLAVELNRKDGFSVWHGTMETVPADWAWPDAVIAFFMLHHVQNPLEFLSTIRSKWPTAAIVVAQYGPANRDPLRSSPPRTLTKWNSKSLAVALRKAGYESKVVDICGTGFEQRGLLRPLRSVLQRTVSVPWVYRLGKRIEKRLLPRLVHPFGPDAYVVLAFAEPIGDASASGLVPDKQKVSL